MPRKLTTEEFIAKAQAIHSDKYGYGRVQYINGDTEVEIYCNACAKYFRQKANVHLQGRGCQECGRKARNKVMSVEEFVRRARAIHGNKYDYSQVKIKTVSDDVTIICPEHGPFLQRPINHYWAKQGCPKCGLIKLGMSIRSNTDDFIRKAHIIHGDKYGYGHVEYVKKDVPVEIYCPVCKDYFLQTPGSHLAGHGCSKCANNKPISTEEFILRAKDVWGDRYIYDKVEYTTNKAKVIVTCRKHGDFPTNAYDFLQGHGCPECGKEAVRIARRKDQEQFLVECKKVHGDKYDYSKTVYEGKRKKITIICPTHGPFEQWPDNHLNGEGCKWCKRDMQKNLYKMGLEKFIEKARKVHGNRYDYSLVEYVNNKTDVTVICPDHGPFKVMPQDHLQKLNGCPKCSTSKGEKKILLWLEANNINYRWHRSIKSELAPGKRKKFIPDFQIIGQENEIRMIIEYNGDQHYKPRPKWGGERQFKYQQIRDEALREYCHNENIPLLEIPYTEFDNIDSILERKLLK